MFDNLLQSFSEEINLSAEVLGTQALIGCLPLSKLRNEVFWYNYLSREKKILTSQDIKKIFSSSLSELLIVDYLNEGRLDSFNLNLLDCNLVRKSPFPLLIFGGISNPSIAKKILRNRKVAAAAIGNFLSYRENNILHFKKHINEGFLREHEAG